LIRRVADAPIARLLLSVGGTSTDELAEAVSLLKGKDLVLMHGFQGYPTHLEDNQLARLGWLRRHYPSLTLGFADHVPAGNPEGLWLSAVAIGAGASVLEKHITTAVVLREEDSESALNPDDFARYVANMRQAYAAMGQVGGGPDFGMAEGELRYRENMKKHVVAARDLPAGATLNPDDVTLKRSGATGQVLRDLRAAVGRQLKTAIGRDRAFRPEDLF
jgi:sialic acid synthase SpsE